MTTIFWNDVRFAFRQLRKTPGFTLTAVLTLALGIGVNAAMFSVIDQVLLRPLPYKNADRMVQIGAMPFTGQGFGPVSTPDIQDWQARNHSFQAIGFFMMQLPSFRADGDPQFTIQVLSSTNLFELLGIQPALGRSFVPADSQPGRSNVLIVGDGMWERDFHRDSHVVGRSVLVNGAPYTVIGVLPPGFDFPATVGSAIYSPLPDSAVHAGSSKGEKASGDERDSADLTPIGLLRPGVSLEQARAELNSIHNQLLKEYPKEEGKEPLRVVDYRDSITENVRPALFALYGSVLAVWLIACANVAGLMLARTNSRKREIAIRSALGAVRGRLIQQSFIESLLLALFGGAAGLGLAALILRTLKQYLASRVFYGDHIHINIAVCIFLLVASCLSAVLFGLLPAWVAANAPAQEGLREGSIATGTSKRQAWLRDALVVGEITLTLALLIAAGLMIRTLLTMRNADGGFQAQNVIDGMLTVPTSAPWTPGSDQGNSPNFVQVLYRPLLDRLRQTPGITAVGLTTVRPLAPSWNFIDSVVVDGRPKANKSDLPQAHLRAVSADYFKTFGVRLVKGRLFDERDTPEAPVAAVVNVAFVKKVFPNEEPLGKRLEISDAPGPRHWATIVGVAENVRQRSMGEDSLPEFDLDLMQLNLKDEFYPLATFAMNVAVRTHLPVATAEDAIRNAVRAINPDVVISDLEPMTHIVDDSMGSQTLAARLLGIFGLAALAIAVAGIYGLLSYSVGQRTREFGVRLALGSPQGNVLWLVLRHALLLLGIGVTAGIAMAVAASSVMRAFIYGFHGYDVFTVFAVALVLTICGLFASYIPARRAAGTDPMVALRSE
jgi:predicted permease